MALKHQTVFRDIQSKILSGYWPENAMIPPELELCATHNVSRITVRRALDDLVQLGLIHRIRGKGTFVTKAKPFAEYRSGFHHQDSTMDDKPMINKILEDVVYPAHTELSKNMLPLFKRNIDTDEGVIRIRLLRLVDDYPYALMSIFFPQSISEGIDRQLLTHRSFLDVYEIGFARKIVALNRSVSAVIPDDEQCEMLGAKPGTAHLWMKNVALLDDETPVASNYALYNGNLFDFAVKIDLHTPSKLAL